MNAQQINSQLVLVKLNGQKFPTVDGYYKPTGYALKHPELGYFAFEGYDYPYTPVGGRKALKAILDAGGFLSFDDSKWLQPIN